MSDEKRTQPGPTRPAPPRWLYMLFDQDGEHADTTLTRDEAKGIAWGPRFRRGYTIVRYSRNTERRTKR